MMCVNGLSCGLKVTVGFGHFLFWVCSAVGCFQVFVLALFMCSLIVLDRYCSLRDPFYRSLSLGSHVSKQMQLYLTAWL